MKFISMDLAMHYMMNQQVIFDKVKESFLNNYQNYEQDLKQLIQQKDIKELQLYIGSLKGISLNLGAQLLYDSAVLALLPIQNDLVDEKSLTFFGEVLGGTYQELKSL